MKIRHYYAFGNDITSRMAEKGAMNDIDWNLLREDGGEAFAIEKTIEEYRYNAKHDGIDEENARIICRYLENKKALCSIGCGKAIVEWWIKQLNPSIRLCCSDYTEDGIKQLKHVFPECDSYRVFDMRGDYSSLKGYDYVLIYRVSTEFNEKEWENIFAKLYESKINCVFFVPANLLHFKDVVRELLICIVWKLKKEKLTFSGWEYSERTIKRIWKGFYTIEHVEYVNNTGIFILKREM